MDTENSISQIQERIHNNDFKGALALLDVFLKGTPYHDEAIHLSSQYNWLKSQYHLGIISDEYMGNELHRIREGMLDLLSMKDKSSPQLDRKNSLLKILIYSVIAIIILIFLGYNFWYYFIIDNNKTCHFTRSGNELNIAITPFKVRSTKVDSKYEDFLNDYLQNLPDSLNVNACLFDNISEDLIKDTDRLYDYMHKNNIDVIITGSYWMNKYDKLISFDFDIFPSKEFSSIDFFPVDSNFNKYYIEQPNIYFYANFQEKAINNKIFMPLADFESAFINGELEDIKEIEKLPYLFRAMSCYKQNKYSEAIDYLGDASQIDTSGLIDFWILCSHLQQGDIQKGIDFFESSDFRDQDYMLIAAIFLFLHDGTFVENKNLFSQIKNKELDKYINIIFGILDYAEDKITADSLTHIFGIKDKYLENITNALFLLSLDNEKIESVLARLLADSMYHYPYYYIKGCKAYYESNNDDVITMFERSLKVFYQNEVYKSDNLEIKLPKSYCYYMLSLAYAGKYLDCPNEIDKLAAIQYSDSLVSLNSKSPVYIYFKYSILDGFGIDSSNLLKYCIELDSQNYIYWYALGDYYGFKSKFQDALKCFDSSIRHAVGKEKMYPMFKKSIVLFNMGVNSDSKDNRYKKQAKDNLYSTLAVINEFTPEDKVKKADIYAHISSIDFAMGEISNGFENAQKSLKFDPANITGNNFSAYYYIIKNDFETAKKYKNKIDFSFDSIYLYNPEFEYYYDLYFSNNQRILNNIDYYWHLNKIEKIETQVVLNIELGEYEKALDILKKNIALVRGDKHYELFYDFFILMSLDNFLNGEVANKDNYGLDMVRKTEKIDHAAIISALYDFAKQDMKGFIDEISILSQHNASHSCFYTSYLYFLYGVIQSEYGGGSPDEYFIESIKNADKLVEKFKDYKYTLEAKEKNLNRLYTYILVSMYYGYSNKKRSVALLKNIKQSYPNNVLIDDMILMVKSLKT